ILRGKVQVSAGGEPTVLQGAGFFGQQLLSSPAHDLSVVCLEETELLALSKEAFGDIKRYHPELAVDLNSIFFSAVDKSDRAPESKHSIPVAAEVPQADNDRPTLEQEPVIPKLRRAFRQFPFIAQTSDADCGAACLAMVCAFHGKSMSLNLIRELA